MSCEPEAATVPAAPRSPVDVIQRSFRVNNSILEVKGPDYSVISVRKPPALFRTSTPKPGRQIAATSPVSTAAFFPRLTRTPSSIKILSSAPKIKRECDMTTPRQRHGHNRDRHRHRMQTPVQPTPVIVLDSDSEDDLDYQLRKIVKEKTRGMMTQIKTVIGNARKPQHEAYVRATKEDSPKSRRTMRDRTRSTSRGRRVKAISTEASSPVSRFSEDRDGTPLRRSARNAAKYAERETNYNQQLVYEEKNNNNKVQEQKSAQTSFEMVTSNHHSDSGTTRSMMLSDSSMVMREWVRAHPILDRCAPVLVMLLFAVLMYFVGSSLVERGTVARSFQWLDKAVDTVQRNMPNMPVFGRK